MRLIINGALEIHKFQLELSCIVRLFKLHVYITVDNCSGCKRLFKPAFFCFLRSFKFFLILDATYKLGKFRLVAGNIQSSDRSQNLGQLFSWSSMWALEDFYKSNFYLNSNDTSSISNNFIDALLSAASFFRIALLTCKFACKLQQINQCINSFFGLTKCVNSYGSKWFCESKIVFWAENAPRRRSLEMK